MSDWPAPNFSPEELRCRGCIGNNCHRNPYNFVEELPIGLQKIRDMQNRPLKINSAYRCPFHNTRVGGAPRSRHKIGDAADISIVNWTREEMLSLIEDADEAGFAGFGFYGTFLHVDFGKRRKWFTKQGRVKWNFLET